MKKVFYFLLTIALVGSIISCSEESLDPTLAQNKDVETSVNNVEDLEGLLRGAYNRMTSSTYYGRDIIIFGEVRSDNCYANAASGRFLTAAAMELGANQAYPTDTWTQIYAVIASANIIIGKEEAELEGDADRKNQIIGQAYAIRALAHYDLLRLYGQQHVGGTMGIPYVTEYKTGELNPARSTVSEVQGFIYDDFDQALALMSDEQNFSSKQYISTYAVHALKSRVATYFADWPEVIASAEPVINSGMYSVVPEADFVASWRLDEAVNSVFELAFSSTDNANINGLQYIYRGSSYGDVRVLDDLLSIFSSSDIRASAEMIGPGPEVPEYLTNIGKYPSMDYSDNIPIIRYEEVLLNYAEALLETSGTGVLGGPVDVINEIRSNRGVQLITAITKEGILDERRRELCFEGFRFDDLARTGQDIPLVAPFLQSHGGPAYGSYKYAFPIPQAEMNANGNMVQNEGY